jgi:hypothetical protein
LKQHHIRELERANAQLKDKLMVAKQQILATAGMRGGGQVVKTNFQNYFLNYMFTILVYQDRFDYFGCKIRITNKLLTSP